MSSFQESHEVIQSYIIAIRHESALKELAQKAAADYHEATVKRNIAWNEIARLLVDGTLQPGIYYADSTAQEVIVLNHEQSFPDILPILTGRE